MAAVTCYSVIDAELAKGSRTEETLIRKCEEYGFDSRGVRVALTRGKNEGRYLKSDTGSYSFG